MVNIEKLFVWSLICLLFLYALHYPVHIPFYGITIPIFAVSSILYFRARRISKILLSIFALLSILTVLHLLVVSFFLAGVNIFSSLRFIGFSALFFFLGSHERLLNKLESRLFFASIILLGAGLLVFLIKPELVSIQVTNHVHRFKLFFGEPSALAPFSGLLIFEAIKRSRPLVLLIPLGTLLATQSLVVMVVSFFALIYSVIIYSRLLTVLNLLIILFLVVLISFTAWPLIYSSFPLIHNRSMLIIDTFSQGLSVEQLASINTRSLNLYKIFEYVMNTPGAFWGFGLNAESSSSLGVELRSFSLLHAFTEAFGFLGFWVCLFLSVFCIFLLRVSSVAWLSIFVFCAMVNSSQGLLMQGFYFTGFGFLLHQHIRSTRPLVGGQAFL